MRVRSLAGIVTLLAGSLLLLVLGRPPVVAGGGVYHSPDALALAPDGKVLYVADQTANQVVWLDPAQGSVRGTVAVREPRGLALSADGKTLYATSGDQDRVYRIDTATRKVTGQAATGRQPVGLVLSPDGKTLYCCCQFSNDVWVFDTATLTRKARLAAVREPRYAAVTPDGKRLVVANQLPLGSNLDESLGAEVNLFDLSGGQHATVKLANGATDVGGVACSADGRYAYVVHVLARWLVPPTQLERGWMATNALTIVDLQTRQRLNTVLLDDLDQGAANLWGVALSPDGQRLYVTGAGGDEVQVVDLARLHKLVAEWPADAPTALEDDLTAVYRAGVRQRVPAGGEGPRAVAADNSGAFVANYFSGTVTRLDLAVPTGCRVTRTLSLGTQPPADNIRRGERLFATSKVCFQGWQSCTSCHPDGRTDALAWDLLNDGLGNPKSAKSLLWSDRTPPAMAHGVRANMPVAVMAGYRYILFHVPDENELKDTEAYLASLQPVRSPRRNPDGSLSPAAKRGKVIFERKDVGCAVCHPAPLFTDLKSYDVGTRASFDTQSDLDTPTLVEIYRTGPYLHDGSAVTLREVLRERNPRDQHGKTKQLSDREVDDLVEYLLSL